MGPANGRNASQSTLAILSLMHCKRRLQFVQSDADEQLILRIPFTGSVKLRSIIVRTQGGEECPNSMQVFANVDQLTFDDASSTTPTQTIDVVQSREPVEYSVRYVVILICKVPSSSLVCRPSKFPSVQSITLFFPDNHGADNTTIFFVGFKGEFSKVSCCVQACNDY